MHAQHLCLHQNSIKMLTEGKIKRMLFMPTGALMSTTTSQQGESIPSVAHGLVIESGC